MMQKVCVTGAAFIFGEDKSKSIGVEYALQKTFPEGSHFTEIRSGLTSLPSKFHYGREADFQFNGKFTQSN